MATAHWGSQPGVLSDFKAERLATAANELEYLYRRIGEVLETVSTQMQGKPCAPMITNESAARFGEAATFQDRLLAERLIMLSKIRHKREEFFDKALFGDPAWDILLDLFIAHLLQQRVPVSAACLAARVPATTALRWIKVLEVDGLVVRHPDPRHGRRIYLHLTPTAMHSMRQFAEATSLAA